ncbi:MAG: 3-hydroxyacyl-CoA dehydrogenase family protein, partial [Candidatus Thorarchaeota archaeon]
VALLAGFEKVTLNDLNLDILYKSKEKIQERIEALRSEENYNKFLESNNITEGVMKDLDFKSKLGKFESIGVLAENTDTISMMSRLKLVTDISQAVMDADFVIEAVPEKLELKRKVFRDLGEYSPTKATLASNTSCMSITEIAKFSSQPEKVIGMHFHTFFPLVGILIEITPGKQSSEESLKIGMKIAQKFPCLVGKRFTVQLEKEAPGLIGNRISLPGEIYFEWLVDYAIENGFSFEQLGALNYIFGLTDAIGLDTIYNILKYFEEHVSSDFGPGNALTNLINKGRFGKKVGKGWYNYNENGTIENVPLLDEKATEFLKPYIDQDIFLALNLNEACRLLEEGAVKSYKLIDKIIAKGNFTPGPFKLGKKRYEEFAKILYNLAEITGKYYFKPCKMMESGDFLSYK